jgi:hypothetical protein
MAKDLRDAVARFSALRGRTGDAELLNAIDRVTKAAVVEN